MRRNLQTELQNLQNDLDRERFKNRALEADRQDNDRAYHRLVAERDEALALRSQAELQRLRIQDAFNHLLQALQQLSGF
jgi:hypothetical protein